MSQSNGEKKSVIMKQMQIQSHVMIVVALVMNLGHRTEGWHIDIGCQGVMLSPNEKSLTDPGPVQDSWQVTSLCLGQQ